ncbi:MAG TPA: alcohol dehydrogenase catalytic domain-containing protein [Thermoanaerobaculia bacterium]
MPKMRAFQVPAPGKPFEMVEREIPTPGPGFVRVKVEANGICHSDVLTKEGIIPIEYPRVPGHEVAGVVDAVGDGVAAWKKGDRVGIGWHGGHCGTCTECRRGNFRFCLVSPLITGISYDGGYADYVIAPQVALARIPDGLSAVEAAPLMDAGVTTFMGLRHSGAQAGELVAVLGVGGLGHLGVQFAAKMGFDTVAIARGTDKEPFVKKLGARVYIDSAKQDPAAELTKLGGARAILATVTSGGAMTAVIGGLGVDGVLEVVGAPLDPLQVPAYSLIVARRSIAGWASGRPIDSEATMKFALQTGVRSMNEPFPLDRAAEAYDRMMSGEARFRVVLTMG